jgi:hypothetical protein
MALYFYRAAWTAGVQKLKDKTKDGKEVPLLIHCVDNGKAIKAQDEAFLKANNPGLDQFFYTTPAQVKAKQKEQQDRIKEQNSERELVDPSKPKGPRKPFSKPFRG